MVPLVGLYPALLLSQTGRQSGQKGASSPTTAPVGSYSCSEICAPPLDSATIPRSAILFEKDPEYNALEGYLLLLKVEQRQAGEGFFWSSDFLGCGSDPSGITFNDVTEYSYNPIGVITKKLWLQYFAPHLRDIIPNNDWCENYEDTILTDFLIVVLAAHLLYKAKKLEELSKSMPGEYYCEARLAAQRYRGLVNDIRNYRASFLEPFAKSIPFYSPFGKDNIWDMLISMEESYLESLEDPEVKREHSQEKLYDKLVRKEIGGTVKQLYVSEYSKAIKKLITGIQEGIIQIPVLENEETAAAFTKVIEASDKLEILLSRDLNNPANLLDVEDLGRGLAKNLDNLVKTSIKKITDPKALLKEVGSLFLSIFIEIIINEVLIRPGLNQKMERVSERLNTQIAIYRDDNHLGYIPAVPYSCACNGQPPEAKGHFEMRISALLKQLPKTELEEKLTRGSKSYANPLADYNRQAIDSFYEGKESSPMAGLFRDMSLDSPPPSAAYEQIVLEYMAEARELPPLPDSFFDGPDLSAYTYNLFAPCGAPCQMNNSGCTEEIIYTPSPLPQGKERPKGTPFQFNFFDIKEEKIVRQIQAPSSDIKEMHYYKITPCGPNSFLFANIRLPSSRNSGSTEGTYIVNRQGDNLRKVSSHVASYYACSNDGQKVIMVDLLGRSGAPAGYVSRTTYYDLSTSQALLLDSIDQCGMYDPTISPNGKYLAVRISFDRPHADGNLLYVYSMEQSNKPLGERFIMQFNNVHNAPIWSTDGNTLFFVETEYSNLGNTIFAYNMVTNKKRALVTPRMASLSSLAPTNTPTHGNFESQLMLPEDDSLVLSHNGNHIAFQFTWVKVIPGEIGNGIAFVNTDGSNFNIVFSRSRYEFPVKINSPDTYALYSENMVWREDDSGVIVAGTPCSNGNDRKPGDDCITSKPREEYLYFLPRNGKEAVSLTQNPLRIHGFWQTRNSPTGFYLEHPELFK